MGFEPLIARTYSSTECESSALTIQATTAGLSAYFICGTLFAYGSNITNLNICSSIVYNDTRTLKLWLAGEGWEAVNEYSILQSSQQLND